MRTVAILLTAVFAALLAACGPGPAAERIDAAEMSLESGDAEGARRGAEHVDTAALTAGELCRLAVVYAAVGEDSCGSEADVAMAARCIRRALAKDSAAVDSFIKVMPVDQRPLMALVVQLCSTTAPGDIRPYEESDSLYSHE